MAPPEPPLGDGERRLMNVWLPGRASEGGLVPAALFPVLELPSHLPADTLTYGSLPRSESSASRVYPRKLSALPRSTVCSRTHFYGSRQRCQSYETARR